MGRTGDGDLRKANAAFQALALTIHQEKVVMVAKLRKDQADRDAVRFAAKTAKSAEWKAAWEALKALSQGRQGIGARP